MTTFKKALAIVAAIALLGTNVYAATQAMADTTQNNVVSNPMAKKTTLPTPYQQLIQNQIGPLQ